MTDHWIPADERLPDEPGKCLVFVPTADPERPLIHVAWYEPEGTDNMPGWQLLPAVLCDAISHWMPLPDPPTIVRRWWRASKD